MSVPHRAASREPGQGPGDSGQGAFATFRPRRGRVVSGTFAVLSVLVFGVIALLLPGPPDGLWRPADRVLVAAVGLSIGALLWRYATIRATPTREALTVRNLFTTRTVSWRSVVDLRFSGGDPWVTLELDDADTLAVMAVQKADGPWGRAEASRLAALVQALGPSAQSPEVTAD
ncbi:PH domain-containing protein [Knoellia sp. 3-2P3]|uniref:PH domain-containing protein n=1 Tax=unclassified Knoellia TaxID=2618719 RepID=UPI0023DC672C|nr:PH domain-containing protein [Knoellia sp. 3-2P3]MDF2091833.1 PH domain-containing protein [Knoellia sp. 3-2P3]